MNPPDNLPPLPTPEAIAEARPRKCGECIERERILGCRTNVTATGVEARVCEDMSDRPTPETDKSEYEVRLGRHRRKVVRPELCRTLERQRDDIRDMYFGLLQDHESTVKQRDERMDKTIDALAQVGNLTEQRDAYAETLREIDLSGMCGNVINRRHPELSENVPAQTPTTGTGADTHINHQTT